MRMSATVKGAIIVAVASVVSGIFSNWDRILPARGTVQASYSGYRPTGDFETEFRYYLEVSGFRKGVQSMQENLLNNFISTLVSQYPSDAEAINKAAKRVREEAFRLDDMINILIPIYKKYYTVSQIQELNKFYSTQPMREMVEKTPYVQEEFVPIIVNKIVSRVKTLFPTDHPVVGGH
jgi:hypothetical protein